MKKRTVSLFLGLALLLTLAVPVGAVDYSLGTEALYDLAYVGDRSLCVMPAEMANAYSTAIGNQGAGVKALLLDPAGDGLPLLATVKYSGSKIVDGPYLWTYQNGGAQVYRFPDRTVPMDGQILTVGTLNGLGALCLQGDSNGRNYFYNYYTVSQAQITEKRWAKRDSSFTSGGRHNEFLKLDNGKKISCEGYDEMAARQLDSAVGFAQQYTLMSFGGWSKDLSMDSTDGLQAMAALARYTDLIQGPKLASPSFQSVKVDGRSVEFQCYALKDTNGDLTNYVKLRDLAAALNGTAAQFEVGWNGAVEITTGQPYTPNGTEGSTPFAGERVYALNASATLVNGAAADLEAIVLTDDAGGAYTYYKLRDLGSALGFGVDWSAGEGITVSTTAPAPTQSAEDDLVFTLEGVRFRIPLTEECKSLVTFEYSSFQGKEMLDIYYTKAKGTVYVGWILSIGHFANDDELYEYDHISTPITSIPGNGILGAVYPTDMGCASEDHEEFSKAMNTLLDITNQDRIQILP